jgi:hypothetical protein
MEGKPSGKTLDGTALTYRHSRNGIPAQPHTTFGNSLGIQSQADHQQRPLVGEYFQGTTSQNGLQANRGTTELPFYSGPEPIANHEVRTGLTNNRAFQMQSTAPMDTPIAPAFTPNVLNPGQDEPNVRCVYPLLQYNPSLNSVPAYPTGLRS